MLDVWPDVFAYGILLVPKDCKPGGSEAAGGRLPARAGRPAAGHVPGRPPGLPRLRRQAGRAGLHHLRPAESRTSSRTASARLQRKANPLGKTLFSIIVPQHQQIVDWLQTLPYVDPERIGFYGLSYGGKTAMRVPALVTDYCLSICSADFNEWVWKNASTRHPLQLRVDRRVRDLRVRSGQHFNYAEMAALICPRPFMVERGHFDGVAPTSGWPTSSPKSATSIRPELDIGDRTEIEWFVGPAHDPRPRDVRLPAQAPELAASSVGRTIAVVCRIAATPTAEARQMAGPLALNRPSTLLLPRPIAWAR